MCCLCLCLPVDEETPRKFAHCLVFSLKRRSFITFCVFLSSVRTSAVKLVSIVVVVVLFVCPACLVVCVCCTHPCSCRHRQEAPRWWRCTLCCCDCCSCTADLLQHDVHHKSNIPMQHHTLTSIQNQRSKKSTQTVKTEIVFQLRRDILIFCVLNSF